MSTSFSTLQLPLGFKFKPTQEEILRHYLWRKVNGKDLPSDAIVELDVYAHEPWLLNWDESMGMSYEDRYYFVEREPMSRNGNGKRPKRTLQGDFDGGWWKANTGDKDIRDDQGNILGHMKTLTFFTYKNSQRKRKEATKSDWIMYEYKLSSDQFEKWVICRIKYTGKRSKQEDMKIPTDSDQLQDIQGMPLAGDRANEQQQQQLQLPHDQMLVIEYDAKLEGELEEMLLPIEQPLPVDFSF